MRKAERALVGLRVTARLFPISFHYIICIYLIFHKFYTTNPKKEV